jgi:hypothetical protein
VLDLLDAMDLSDEMLKEHPRAAVQRSVIDVFSFIIAAAATGAILVSPRPTHTCQAMRWPALSWRSRI